MVDLTKSYINLISLTLFHWKVQILDMLRVFTRAKSSNRGLVKCTKEILANPPLPGSEIELSGWVAASRVSKNVAFLDIIDGTTNEDIKCVIRPPSLLPANVGTCSSVRLNGIWSEGKGSQKFEIQIRDDNNGKIELLGPVEDKYPLTKKEHSLQFLRSIPQYRWRQQDAAAILRFRSQVESSFVEFFDKEYFTKTQPPLITTGDCEGAGELFRIESNSKLGKKEAFFGKETFMTVSTQLHLEVLCQALNRVWVLSPCFRAEESDTNRHLAEFWMLEVEIAFVEDVSQLTTFAETMIKSVVQKLVNNTNGMGDNLISAVDKSMVEIMQNRWNMLLAKQWDSITYTEAIEILRKEHSLNRGTFKFEPSWGESLKSEHEKWLAGVHFNNPVFVTDYPLEEKAFYMKINNNSGTPTSTVACFDMLVPDVGELIGGSLREHDLAKLETEIQRRGMDIEPLQWYLDQRRNGSVPHGGFGMGFERLLQYLSYTDNIKDVIPFSRSTNSCLC